MSPRAWRVCLDCPEPVPPGRSRCDECRRAADKARGTRQQRGYDAPHDRERRRWEPQVAAGNVRCARCGGRIRPGERWHLGHTDDRTDWHGPEHELCNLSAAGRASHGV